MTANLEASNWRLQITEQGSRIVAGAALVMRAPVPLSRFQDYDFAIEDCSA